MHWQQAVFNYLLLVINDFREFRKLSEESLNDFSPRISLEQIFNFEEYIEAQLPENQDFFYAFTQTQLFNDFLERCFSVTSSLDNLKLQSFLSFLDIMTQQHSFSDVISYQRDQITSASIMLSTPPSQVCFADVIEAYERCAEIKG